MLQERITGRNLLKQTFFQQEKQVRMYVLKQLRICSVLKGLEGKCSKGRVSIE